MTEWVFLMSLTGSFLFLVWWLLCRLVGNRLHARWQYASLKLPLLFLLLPIGPCLKALQPIADSAVSIIPALYAPSRTVPPVLSAAEPQLVSPSPMQLSISVTTSQVLGVLWLLGAAAVLLYKGIVFFRFKRRLQSAGRIAPLPRTQILLLSCQQQLGVLGTIQVWVCPAAPTSFVTGLFRPVIVLPDQPFSYQELRYILLHELTHLKRRDLWVRWASLLALAIHWWNPLVYLLDRKMIELSEESCDEQVVAGLSHEERYQYGQVLLKAVCSAAMPEELAAPLSTTKWIQRRLSNMLHVTALTRRKKFLSVCLILALLACGTATALAARSPIAIRPESSKVDAPPSASQSIPPSQSPSSISKAGSTPEALTDSPAGNVPVQIETEDTTEAAAPVLENSEVSTGSARPSTPNTPVPEQPTQEHSDNKVIAVVSEGDQLLYTQYADGSKVYSAYYQQQLEQVLNEANEAGVLIHGQYPRNSSGETYGPGGAGIYGLSAAVGEEPALIAAVGTEGEHGYIRNRDEALIPRNLPAEQCPHTFMIPLYDSEGAVIGEFSVSCGGHISTGGKTIEQVQAEIAQESVVASPIE